MKGLLPTLRQKKRFIIFRIISKKKFKFNEISFYILDKLILFLGTISFGEAGIWLLRDYFDYEKQLLILRTSTKLKDKTIGALLLIDELCGENVKIEIIGVSGTLKGCLRQINEKLK